MVLYYKGKVPNMELQPVLGVVGTRKASPYGLRAAAAMGNEIAACGTPCILIPSPNVTNGHQEKNARVLERAGGAKVLLEGEFDAASLLEEIKSLLCDEDKLSAMSEAMAALAVREATDRICDITLSLIN